MGTRRVWLLVNLAVTVALVPALFLGRDHTARGPVAVRAGETLRTLPVAATAAPGTPEVVVLGPTRLAAQATTTTTAPPPPTTTRPRPVVHRAPAKRPVLRPKAVPTTTTTTTAKPRPQPAPRPPAAPPSPDRTESGKASWYDHRAGVCAHKSLPFGTVVTVTNTANGRSTTCVVGDRGPFVDGWVLDLNPREFEQLAPRSTGVIPVRLTW